MSDGMRGDDPAERGWLRWFYRGWRPTLAGRWLNRVQAWWTAIGLPSGPQRTLEVRGRKSGRWRSVPVGVAHVAGHDYLVSMLGPQSEWVKNVRAAGGEAVIRKGRRRRVHLVELPTQERAPVLREYVRIARSGRRHFPVAPGAPIEQFEAIAGRYPVFRIEPV